MTYGTTLRFTPYAFAKLIFMRDKGNTEVAGYCITGTEDPLLVTDFVLVKQTCTTATFDLDTVSCVEHMDTMLDKGISPWQSSNILAHTHPGNSPSPSGTDEENFAKAFSRPDWAIMVILAKDGSTYCRLKGNVGPGITKNLGVEIDWTSKFAESKHAEWNTEYHTNVTEEKITSSMFGCIGREFQIPDDDFADIISQRHENDDSTSEISIDDLDCYVDQAGDIVYWDEEDCIWYYYDPVTTQWYKDQDGGDTLEPVESPQKPWRPLVEKWALLNCEEHEVLKDEEK